ncbi:MFS transporter [Tuwongella immobilis]|uniref:Major facilitator superfamily (MFS) profile domain-containing protein n=1 Tax=Tuwongella immobilis TaxID=692036 RepID=A0A6C2YIW8_9BACT
MNPLKVKLSIMMFLQYTVWGVWAPVLALHLGQLESFREDTGWKIGMIYLTMAIASMVAPMIAGQLVDRFFATEKYLAFSHIAGAAAIIYAATQQDFGVIFLAMFVHCFFYAPTVPLTNSLSFAHLSDAERDFGKVRLWGTIGWAAIGGIFGLWLNNADEIGFTPRVGDCLYFAGGLGVIMGIFSLTLPYTPPSKKSDGAFAFLKAFKLAKDRSFALLLFVAFLVSTELQFYYVQTPSFFGDTSGLSLSTTQLAAAGKLDPTADKDKITTIYQAFDINRNKKMSKDELSDASIAQRTTELNAVKLKLQGEAAPISKDKLIALLADTKLATETRNDAAIADYAFGAADTDQDQQLSVTEVDAFLAKVNGVLPMIPGIVLEFDANATEKGGLNLSSGSVPMVMAIGQVAEILVLLLLPFALKKFGYGITIAIGIGAWAVRYGIFALGDPRELVIASQTLHGFGFGFFFVASFLYADRIAPKDIRGSTQGLIIFITYGAGMIISSLVSGKVADYFENDWQKVFFVPVAITVVCMLIFLFGFRESPPYEEDPKSEVPTA